MSGEYQRLVREWAELEPARMVAAAGNFLGRLGQWIERNPKAPISQACGSLERALGWAKKVRMEDLVEELKTVRIEDLEKEVEAAFARVRIEVVEEIAKGEFEQKLTDEPKDQ